MNFLLNRHGRAGLPMVDGTLDLGVEQELLQSNRSSILFGEEFSCHQTILDQKVVAEFASAGIDAVGAAGCQRCHLQQRLLCQPAV